VKVHELIAKLSVCEPDAEVMIEINYEEPQPINAVDEVPTHKIVVIYS
jgi:hypothetical protein